MTSPPASPSDLPFESAIPQVPGWLAIVNYLIPGAGYCIAGRWVRGLLQTAMVLMTMAIGFALHGGVPWPSWSPQASDFNLINNLTFIVQLGGGLPALASLAANLKDWPFLQGIPHHAYYELGGYY